MDGPTLHHQPHKGCQGVREMMTRNKRKHDNDAGEKDPDEKKAKH